MKKHFNIFLLLLSVVGLVLTACSKKENPVVFQGGNAPVLTASVTGAVPLAYASQNQQALKLTWTNPGYTFNTGVSSQNVTYTLELDTLGANFTSPKRKIITISNNLSQSFTQRELNIILLNDMELSIGKTYKLQARITASLGEFNAVPLSSNILNSTVVPYQDPTLLPPDLYITGDATAGGWTNSPPDNQKFAFIGAKTYVLTMSFQPGKAYKFLTSKGNWQPQYGTSSNGVGTTPVPLNVNDGSPGSSDPDAIPTPGAAGNYKITVNLGDKTFFVVKQ